MFAVGGTVFGTEKVPGIYEIFQQEEAHVRESSNCFGIRFLWRELFRLFQQTPVSKLSKQPVQSKGNRTILKSLNLMARTCFTTHIPTVTPVAIPANRDRRCMKRGSRWSALPKNPMTNPIARAVKNPRTALRHAMLHHTVTALSQLTSSSPITRVSNTSLRHNVEATACPTCDSPCSKVNSIGPVLFFTCRAHATLAPPYQFAP